MAGLGVLATVDLPGEAASVRRARDEVRDLLVQAGVREVEDALLLLSEVLTNAVRHTASGQPGGQVRVALRDFGARVQVDVMDEGSDTNKPDIGDLPQDEDVDGRGLWLVQALALDWGWHEDVAGRTVWFQVAR
ncbi:ATP-binding protein [Acrocarpospora catenulata]|uniref:ATP-binding protein n=1 Tax=Acrocarpospora catenulata TaxID=2836182 RepID=UPI001BDAE137|nr:ATP-binding protein [Acrocarpospora catenulata]